MTLENRILQKLGAGPVRTLDIEDAEGDELVRTLHFMAARRQICMKAGWVSLYWHRYMIAPVPVPVAWRREGRAHEDAALPALG
ncbi:hypothetical protein MOK15_07155 [Sphingobium sp. BYY-5]|uniref:hypothetical protein n=1 Tax=Sphingobium sp. BYY-5 TaxID=2926400 RepID=UPI001FA6B705|nr:hypothetical protein [Sphingobium sp. BYY-5]MCI4589867.1 hypothetical protein [Sphingobium sp. BYY-5]